VYVVAVLFSILTHTGPRNNSGRPYNLPLVSVSYALPDFAKMWSVDVLWVHSAYVVMNE